MVGSFQNAIRAHHERMCWRSILRPSDHSNHQRSLSELNTCWTRNKRSREDKGVKFTVASADAQVLQNCLKNFQKHWTCSTLTYNLMEYSFVKWISQLSALLETLFFLYSKAMNEKKSMVWQIQSIEFLSRWTTVVPPVFPLKRLIVWIHLGITIESKEWHCFAGLFYR